VGDGWIDEEVRRGGGRGMRSDMVGERKEGERGGDRRETHGGRGWWIESIWDKEVGDAEVGCRGEGVGGVERGEKTVW